MKTKYGKNNTATKTRVMKITSDDWYPSFKLSGWYNGQQNIRLVEVSFLGPSDGFWRCCVWGSDDTGMEYDGKAKATVWKKFLAVISKESVSVYDLNKLGFVPA